MKDKINLKKSQNGITLIALVVTIIVLLILAGISINMLTGQNGIFNRASEAKIAQEIAQVEEVARLRLQAAYTENLGMVDDATAKTAVLAELATQGYETKDISNSNETVKGILIQDTTGKDINEVGVTQGKTVSIKVKLDTEGDTTTKTYVKIQGKYYEIDITGQNVNVSREAYKEVPNEGNGYQIKLTPPSSGAEMTAGGTKITTESPIVAGAEIIVKGTSVGTFSFNVKEPKTNTTRDVNVVVSTNPLYATGLTINVKDGGSTTVEAGKKVTIVATKTPESSTDTVKWSIKSGSATIDNQGNVTINSDAQAGSTVVVAANLVRDDGTTSNGGEKTITLTVKAKVAGAEAIKTSYGTSVAAANAKDLIGAQVTNYNDGNDDGKDDYGWQIFYIGTEPGGTEERIYLISTDYIKVKNYPNASDGTSFASTVEKYNRGNYARKNVSEITKFASLRKTISDRSLINGLKIASSGSGGDDVSEGYKVPYGFINVYGNYSGSSYINSNSKAKKWISWANQYSSSTNENIRSVSYMLDTNVWTRQYGDNNFADYVIGGPTLEMFVASWNTKHPDNKIYCNGTGSRSEYGYYVGWTSGTTNYSGIDIGTSDSTYVKTDDSKADGFRLASPYAWGGNDGYYVLGVSCGGSVYGGLYNDRYSSNSSYTYYGFRPLVCLSSNVKLVSNNDGTYKLQK